MKVANRKEGFKSPCCPLFPVHQTFPPSCIICLTWADLQPDNLHPWVGPLSPCTGCSKSNGSLMQVIDKLKTSEPLVWSVKHLASLQQWLHKRQGGPGEEWLFSTTLQESSRENDVAAQWSVLPLKAVAAKDVKELQIFKLAVQEYPSVKQGVWGQKCRFYFQLFPR